jgi:hypothetical protein
LVTRSPRVEGDEAKEGYRKEVAALEEALANALPAAGAEADELAVWKVYAGTERLIAILRFRFDYETPGVFTKLPDASDPAKLLTEARGLLSKSSEEMARGALVESIETLRKARNNLRSYLTDKRKSAIKSQRPSRSKPSV